MFGMESTAIAATAIGAVAGTGAGAFGRGVLRRARRGVDAPRGWCELPVACAWALLAARAACGQLPLWWLPVPVLLGWLGALLSVCDLRARRLPNVLTLPAYPVAVGLLVPTAHSAASPALLVRAVLGALVFSGCYALVHLVSPRAMGAGDVKLAGSLGLAVGAVSPHAVLLTVLAAAGLTLLRAGWGWVRGKGGTAVPHGPAMLLPAWLITAFTVPLPGG